MVYEMFLSLVFLSRSFSLTLLIVVVVVVALDYHTICFAFNGSSKRTAIAATARRQTRQKIVD